jgi:hypothetical protein
MALSNSERQRRWRDKRNLIYKVTQAGRPSIPVLKQLDARIRKMLARERSMSAAYQKLICLRQKEVEDAGAASEMLANLKGVPDAGGLMSECLEQMRVAEKRARELDVLIAFDAGELRTVRHHLKTLRDSQRILGKRL